MWLFTLAQCFSLLPAGSSAPFPCILIKIILLGRLQQCTSRRSFRTCTQHCNLLANNYARDIWATISIDMIVRMCSRSYRVIAWVASQWNAIDLNRWTPHVTGIRDLLLLKWTNVYTPTAIGRVVLSPRRSYFLTFFFVRWMFMKKQPYTKWDKAANTK